jgi:RNA polymerase sigma-70 factor (ECF subfamily)
MTPEQPDRLRRIRECLAQLAGGRVEARDDLIATVLPVMTDMAHGMLVRFPNVRRWDETGDVVQNAALRLHRSLAAIHPASDRDFLNFAAVHIRREILDLARKYAGRESFASHHETSSIRSADGVRSRIDSVADAHGEEPDLDRWTRMHEAVAELPEEHREVFHLRMYAGLTPTEIAEALECSTKTVHRHWAAATRFIEERVNDRRNQP